MTLDEQNANSLGCYHDALAALRLRAVATGEVFPREREPIDLVLLAALGEESRNHKYSDKRASEQPPSTYNTTEHKGG